MKCPYCSKDIQDGIISCPHCGKAVISPNLLNQSSGKKMVGVVETFSMSTQTRSRNKKNSIVLLIVGGIGILGAIYMIFYAGFSFLALGGFAVSLLFVGLGYFSSSLKGAKMEISSDGIQNIAAINNALKWQEIDHVEITTLPYQTSKVVYIYPKNVAPEQRWQITDYYERFDELINLIRQNAKQNSIEIKES